MYTRLFDIEGTRIYRINSEMEHSNTENGKK